MCAARVSQMPRFNLFCNKFEGERMVQGVTMGVIRSTFSQTMEGLLRGSGDRENVSKRRALFFVQFLSAALSLSLFPCPLFPEGKGGRKNFASPSIVTDPWSCQVKGKGKEKLLSR